MKLTELVFAVLWLAAIFGWCKNIYILATISQTDADFGLEIFLRIIGIIIAPLGAVMGYV
jgi:hypothetical protein